jgi:hypothetical protein
MPITHATDGGRDLLIEELEAQTLYGVMPRTTTRPASTTQTTVPVQEDSYLQLGTGESGEPLQVVQPAQTGGSTQQNGSTSQQQAQTALTPTTEYYSDESGAVSLAPSPSAQPQAAQASAFNGYVLNADTGRYDAVNSISAQALLQDLVGSSNLGSFSAVVTSSSEWGRSTELRDASGAVVMYVDENLWDHAGSVTVIYRGSNWQAMGMRVISGGSTMSYLVGAGDSRQAASESQVVQAARDYLQGRGVQVGGGGSAKPCTSTGSSARTGASADCGNTACRHAGVADAGSSARSATSGLDGCQ